jgi:hypothetical protein
MSDAMFPREAERLGPYQLITELASGGMATVYLARRAGLGGFSRSVAIKRLRAEIAQAPPFLAMLIDEANLAARIHHPNVAATLEFATDGDEHYLVMEYVEGGSLLDLVSQAAELGEVLPPRVVIRVVLDGLAGLHAAHELRGDDGALLDLVHRDLSPHNLMVGLDGCTRVVDFGLARAASRLTKTAVGTLKGKLAYMAPEQLHQRPLDRRADLFAMGAVLWEGLRGERLFRAETDVATIERVLRGEIPSLRASLPWLSTGVNAAVMKALARDPDSRFSSAEEMAAVLTETAEAANLLGSRREVGACVARLLGAGLAARRERLREWMAKHEEPMTMPAVTQMSFAATTHPVPSHAEPSDHADDIAAMKVIVDDLVIDERVADAAMKREGNVRRFVTPERVGAKDVLESLAPSAASEPTAVVARRRRSFSPVLVGAAIGLCAIGVALMARGGVTVGRFAQVFTHDAPSGSPAPARQTPAAEPAPVEPTTARSAEVVARPEIEEAVATPSSEIIAAPEPAASASAPPRRAWTRGRNAPARRPAAPRDPVASAPGPSGSLDNPYK